MAQILKTSALAAAFLAAGSLWLPGVSSAEDVWCASRGGRSFYLDSDSINAENLPKEMTYRVLVKAVRDGDGALTDTMICGFESQNDVMVGAVFDPSAGRWEYAGRAGERPLLKAVWETMKPYLRQKRISYSDSWAWE